jgi:cytidine deaminase
MEYNGLLKLFRYKATEKKTPLENYATESFILLLNYLYVSKYKLFEKIIKLFNVSVVPGSHFNISSQHRINNDTVIPDICIESEKGITIIEVKIDSGLNKYRIKGKNINQFERYRNCETVNTVYLLSKNVISTPNIPKDNKILWATVYEILEKSDDFLVKTFLTFLEENGMKSVKLDKSVLNIFQSLESLTYLIKSSWNYEKYCLSSFNVGKNNGKRYFGCNIKDKKKNKNLFWVGLAGGESQYLYFYLAENIKEFSPLYFKEDKEEQTFVSSLCLDDLFPLGGPEQKQKIETWFQDIMEKKLKDFVAI